MEFDRAANESVIPPTLVSSGGVVGAFHVTSADGEVNVSLTSRLIETNPTVSYLWSLRVFDGSREPKLISEHYYNDQVFKIPLRERTRPTFRESLTLRPGAYRIQVNLHRIRSGFDLAKLANKEVWLQNAVLSVTEKVKVAP